MPYKREHHTIHCPKCNKDYQVLTQSYIKKMKDEKYGKYCSSCRAKIQWEEMSIEEKEYIKKKSKEGIKIYNANLSEEKKEENKKKRKEGLDKYWKNMSNDERNNISSKRSINQKNRISNMSKEERKRINNKLSNTLKIKNENMTQEEKDKRKLQKQEERKIYWDKKKQKYSIKNQSINKRFENAFSESYLVNDYYIKPNISTSNNGLSYEWDYGIFNKNNDTLEMVVLFDNKSIDPNIGLSIPDNIKHSVIIEKKLFQSFNYLIKTLITHYDELVEYVVMYCRSVPFPFPKYNDKELINTFNHLIKMQCNKNDSSVNTRSGDRLISHFHESIYMAKRCDSDLSPYEAWYDDELMRKVIRNRIVYQNYLSPSKILQGFNIAKVAQRVSVFSAGRAKLLIYKYLNDCNTIFDPFSGFSGRMLGAISLNKTYIGQDISLIHTNESNNMINFLKNYFNIDATILQKDILQSYGEYECLFTCSPYSDKEQWIDIPVDNRSCDDWIDECLKRFKCKKYLFVVDETIKYKKYIVESISNRAHMSNNSEYIILIKGDDINESDNGKKYI